MYDVMIVGAGPAGLTAAIYAVRSGKSVLVLEGEVFGGQITLSPEIENYPGIAGISGNEFAERLLEQAQNLGAEVLFGRVCRAEQTKEGFLLETEDEEVYEGKTLIAATGAKHRLLGAAREEELTGRGVSYCAVCDGAFYKGKAVAVAGGGNTALQDAMYLAKTSGEVYLIHRRDTFRAEARLVEALKQYPNIICVMDSEIVALEGERSLEGVTVRNKRTDETKKLLVQGLFVAVGMVPDNQVFAALADLDESGYLIAGEDCSTKTPGFFAAGDCRTKQVRQLTTAAADGSVSGLAAANKDA